MSTDLFTEMAQKVTSEDTMDTRIFVNENTLLFDIAEDLSQGLSQDLAFNDEDDFIALFTDLDVPLTLDDTSLSLEDIEDKKTPFIIDLSIEPPSIGPKYMDLTLDSESEYETESETDSQSRYETESACESDNDEIYVKTKKSRTK